MELREIFDQQVLKELEEGLFFESFTWRMNFSGSQLNKNIGKNFECFALNFDNLKSFKHYDYLRKTCNKIYTDRNLRFDELRSKILIYPSGYDGLIHVDSSTTDNILTTITFLNSDWQKTWGGEILCYSKDCKVVVGGVVPDFGKTFLFNGAMPHRAIAPIRMSSLLRTVLVTKEQE